MALHRFFDTDPAMSFEAIGKELGIPTTTVFWIYNTALSKMRKQARRAGMTGSHVLETLKPKEKSNDNASIRYVCGRIPSSGRP